MDNNTGYEIPERSAILDIVITSLQEVANLSNNSSRISNFTEETRLIGQDAVLDSMGLVSLIVDVEQTIDQEYGLTLILADERAMSQKRSPFRSVRSLTDYILQLIEEQRDSEGT